MQPLKWIVLYAGFSLMPIGVGLILFSPWARDDSGHFYFAGLALYGIGHAAYTKIIEPVKERN